jgi:hypothetical protein
MAAPIVPSQFEVGKNKIVHKPTRATFIIDKNHSAFNSVDWGRAGEEEGAGPTYRKEDILRVAQQLLSRIPR